MKNIRFEAVKLFLKWEENQAFINKSLNHYLSSNNIEQQDKSFLSYLLIGTIKKLIEIDSHIKYLAQKKVNVDKFCLAVLRLGMFQVLYMDNIKDFAVVNEMVDIQKKHKNIYSGFVNAILRKSIEKKGELVGLCYLSKKNKIEYLSIKYSIPEDLVRHFISQYGEKRSKSIFEYYNSTPKSYLRINTKNISEEACISYLEKLNVRYKKNEFVDSVIEIEELDKLINSDFFIKGYGNIQDLSSIISTRLVDANCDVKNILDICSAPGGKIIGLLNYLNNPKVNAIACDIHDSSLELLRTNIKNAKLDVNIIKNDARKLNPEFIDKFDYIIADLPCSGLGVLARKADIKYRTSINDIQELSKIQNEILINLVKYLKKDGILIYSTCTLSHDENFKKIEFIKENGLYMMPITKYLPSALCRKTSDMGFIEIYPGELGSDGFFIAKFKK